MKEKLLERLKLMDEQIVKQNDTYQQAMAALNALHGCKQELMHIINLHDVVEKEKAQLSQPNSTSEVEPDVRCEVA